MNTCHGTPIVLYLPPHIDTACRLQAPPFLLPEDLHKTQSSIPLKTAATSEPPIIFLLPLVASYTARANNGATDGFYCTLDHPITTPTLPCSASPCTKCKSPAPCTCHIRQEPVHLGAAQDLTSSSLNNTTTSNPTIHSEPHTASPLARNAWHYTNPSPKNAHHAHQNTVTGSSRNYLSRSCSRDKKQKVPQQQKNPTGRGSFAQIAAKK